MTCTPFTSVPRRLRWRLARYPEALRAVIDVAVGEIRSFYERRGTSTGAITVVQRFGSKLNLNVHLHVLFLDGAFELGPKGRPVFRQGPHVTDDDVGALVAAIAERVLARLPATDEAIDEDEPLALFQAASIRDSSALGEVQRTQRVGGRERALPPLCAAVDGFKQHAGRRTPGCPSGRATARASSGSAAMSGARRWRSVGSRSCPTGGSRSRCAGLGRTGRRRSC